MTRTIWLSGIALLSTLLSYTACGSDDGVEVGEFMPDGGGSGGPSTGGSSTGSGGSAGATFGDGGIALCGAAPCACSNGIDDDEDGKVDGLDEECTGPLDNDEGSFATGIPGDNRDPVWQDCFFDGNSGAGDDDCRYHTNCLTGDLDMSDPDCTVSDTCVEYCGARTPNGCDCFGCCEVATEEGTVFVITGGQCSLETIDDEQACPRCVQTTQCGNTCGECELCPGRTVEDLPDSCTPDGGPPTHTCDNGEQVCEVSEDCPAGYYCQLGCCLVSVR